MQYPSVSELYYIIHTIILNFITANSHGVFGPYAMKFVRDIGRKNVQVTNDRWSTSFLQRITIAIQRGIAATILKIIPVDHYLDECFNYLNSSYLTTSSKSIQSSLQKYSINKTENYKNGDYRNNSFRVERHQNVLESNSLSQRSESSWTQ